MANSYTRNILYILPSLNWTTKERFALKDMLIAKDHGYNVYLSTYLDSFLAKVAIENGIEVLPIQEHFINRFTKFHKHYPLQSIVKKISVDIVHCYDFHFLFSISSQLRAMNLTSLVITQDHQIDKPLQKFWYRPLISRIDSLILTNQNLRNDVIGNLGLPIKKIEYFGMGIQVLQPQNPEEVEEHFKMYENYFLAGTHLSPELENLDDIGPILLSLKVMNQNLPDGQKCKIVLLSSIDFKFLKIFDKLKIFIQENEIQHDILFALTRDITGVMSKLSLWISNGPNELVEDHSIAALFQDVPILMVRNFCSRDLLREYVGIGEIYQLHDARELREKWTKILMGHSVFKDKVRLFKYFIEREHNFKVYRAELLNLYGKMTQRRARVFRKK